MLHVTRDRLINLRAHGTVTHIVQYASGEFAEGLGESHGVTFAPNQPDSHVPLAFSGDGPTIDAALQQLYRDNGRLIIVGDVHGMRAELAALLQEVQVNPLDTLVFAGDVIDKGPDVPGVLDTIQQLKAGFNVALVEGNHEYAARRRGLTTPDHPLLQWSDLLEGAMAYYTTEEIPGHGRITVIHGGIPEGLTSASWLRNARWGVNPDTAQKKLYNQALRLRNVRSRDVWRTEVRVTVDHPHELGAPLSRALLDCVHDALVEPTRVEVVSAKCHPAGSPVPLGGTDGDPVPWATRYDGRFGHVYFGHAVHDFQNHRYAHATALDFGAVYGKKLCAAVIAPNRPPRFVTVDATQAYAAEPTEET